MAAHALGCGLSAHVFALQTRIVRFAETAETAETADGLRARAGSSGQKTREHPKPTGDCSAQGEKQSEAAGTRTRVILGGWCAVM